MKGKRSKRLSVFLGALLCFVMVIGLLPTKALAEGGSSAAEPVMEASQEETEDQADKEEEATEPTAAPIITPTAASSEGTEEPSAVPATTNTNTPEAETDKKSQENSLDEASPKKAPANPKQNSGVKGDSADNPVTTTEELAAAVSAAETGDTIYLGKGHFSLYNQKADAKNKNLTFIGSGIASTFWGIGAETPDPEHFGTEFNGDYSFDSRYNAGGKGNLTDTTIKWQNMTLQSGGSNINYLGFIGIGHTIVENCVVNGGTNYWGYQDSIFRNTTFNNTADYVMWTNTGTAYTFDGCIFNVAGKTLNVYRDSVSSYGSTLTVNLNNCTINSTKPNKSVLNIKDQGDNPCGWDFVINVNGNIAVSGLNANSRTCSRLFQVYNDKNTGTVKHYATVNINGTPVWKDGARAVDHNFDGITGGSYTDGTEGAGSAQYTDGYKDNAFDTSTSEWFTNADGSSYRTITKICRYCGYAETSKEEKPAAPKQWEYSKSKMATNLDEHFQSNVSLTLPSSEQQLTTEICFVLDGSSYSNTGESALKMLSSLKEAVAESGAKIQVDIVGFKQIAYDDGSYDLATQYDEIAKAFQKKHSHGTNMHAGLLLAKEVLARDTSIPDSRKYMILISDGDSYLYCKNGDYTTPYSRSFIPAASAGGQAYGGFYDEAWYKPSAPYGTNVGRPKTNDVMAWDRYLKDIADRNAESNGDSYEYIWNYYDHLWENKTPEEVSADGFKTMPTGNAITGENTRQASNIDMAYLYAASAYSELAQKYNCCALQAQSLNTADGGKSAFMGYLNNVGNGGTVDFRTIRNDIVYYLDAGSTVEDYMGYSEGNYNFNLDAPSSMVIVVKDADGKQKTYNAVKISENKYGFKPVADSGNPDSGEDTAYSYVAEYFPGDRQKTEHLVWTINVPVTNFEHVSLNYTLKLENPKTEPGTYGQYDANGSQNYDGLFTNGKAVLNPVDSKGQTGAPEEFAKPTVSYTVPATITYTDGVEKEEIFADQEYKAEIGQKTPPFEGTPVRDGYTFKGWAPSVADTVAGNVKYTAVWEKIAETPGINPTPTDSGKPASPAPTGSIKPASPAKPAVPVKTAVTAQTAGTSPKTGDSSSLMLWMLLFAAAAAGTIGICVYARKKKNIK
ncbi:hypothetical protein [Bilifractor porci]|uniref:Gram-positive cocci surface proteins LPxTG domain-containing protein n=1 Tax=Bilifractor porci TaxID=2606636 RepID=A0A7X2TMQ9_9FIRM|nr:hypothetical protein [Bilifractor porci]MST81474.1 hypothetical protein [Bilifractor porci]